jgi:hypothetical protein
MSDQEVTLGEVARKVDSLAASVATLTSLPNWADVARVEKGLEAKITVVTDRLARTEGWGNWATKLALGAMGTAIISGKVFGAG